MKICTKAKAAKLLKVSRATIYAMIDRGELVIDELGYVDLDQLPPGKDFSKPGRKRKEKNESADSGSITQTAEQLKERYIAELEQTVKFLREEMAKVTEDLFEQRKNNSELLAMNNKLQAENYQLQEPIGVATQKLDLFATDFVARTCQKLIRVQARNPVDVLNAIDETIKEKLSRMKN